MSLVDLYVKELLMQQKLGREFQYHQHQQQQQQHSPQPQPFLPPSQPIGPHQQMQQISSSTPSSSSSSSTSSQFYVNQQTQRHQQRPFFSSKTAILQQCPPPTMFDPFTAAAAVAANFMQQQSFAAPTQQPFPAMASAFYGMGNEGVPFQQQQMAPNYSYFPPFGFGFPLANNFTHSPSCGSLNSTGSCVSLDSFTSSPDSTSSCGSASSLNGLNGPPFPLNGGRTPQTTIAAADNANHNQLPKRQFSQQGAPQTARRPTAATKSRVQQQQQPTAAAPTDFSELAALIAAAPKDSKSSDGGGVNGKRAEHFLPGQPTAQKAAQKVFTTKAVATAAKSQKRPQQQQQQPKLQQIQQRQQQQGHMGGKSMFFHAPTQQQQQQQKRQPVGGNGIVEEPPKKMARKLGATIFVPMERFGALGLGKASSHGLPSTGPSQQMHFGAINSCVQQQKTTNAAAAASSRPVAVRTPVTSTTQTQTSTSPAVAQMATFAFDVPSHKLAAMPMPTASVDKDRKEEKDGRKKEEDGTNNKMGMVAQTTSQSQSALSTIVMDNVSSACDGQKKAGGMPKEEEGMGVLPKRVGNAMLMDVENELKARSPLLLFDPILGQMAAAKENAQKETKQTEEEEEHPTKMKKKTMKMMKRTLEEKRRGNDEEKTEKKKKKKKKMAAADSEKPPTMNKKMKPLAKLKAVAAKNVLTTADLAAAMKEEEKGGGEESGGMPWRKEKKPVGIQSPKPAAAESRGGSFLGGDGKADQGKENPPRLVVEVKVEIGPSSTLESSAKEVCVHQADLLGKVAEEEKEEKEEEDDQLEADDDNDEEEEENEEEHIDKTAISCRWTKCKERFVDQDSLYDHLASAHIEPLKKWVLAERRELEQRKAGGLLKRRRSNGGGATAAEVKERFRCRWRQCEQFTRRGDAQKKLDWLLQHLVIRHAPKARPFTCLFTGCALRFPKVQSLNDHLRSAHDDTNGGRNCGRKCASEEVKVSCFEFRTRVHLPIVSDCIDARTIEWIRCRQDADSYPHMKEVHQSQQPSKHTNTGQIGRAKARKIICPRGTTIRDQQQQQRAAFNVKLECAENNGMVEMKQEANDSCQPRMPIRETIKLVKGLFNTRKRRRLHRPKY